MKKNLLVAACAIAFDANTSQTQLVLIPDGIFSGVDNRPFDAPHWNLTAENGQALAAALNKLAIDMVIDYEHGTLKAQKTGEPAPAAGWVHSGSFEYMAGIGLCSNSWNWTPRASEMIAAEEYKYLSPVIQYNPDGAVHGLLCVALTNTPNLDSLPPALLAAAAQDFFNSNSEESNMDELLEQLRWMLNLPLSATAEEIKAELGKLQSQISDKTGVAVAANSKHLFDAVTAIDTLKTAANSQSAPDPSKFVPISMYDAAKAKIADLSGEVKTKAAEDLITAALSDGRLLGADAENWARDFADRDFDGFKKHLEATPKVAALSQQQSRQTPQTPPAASGQLDDVTAAIAAQMGVDTADITKFGAQV